MKQLQLISEQKVHRDQECGCGSISAQVFILMFSGLQLLKFFKTILRVDLAKISNIKICSY